MYLEGGTDPKSGPFYVGVDVGTGSARACLVNNAGDILKMHEEPINREELIQDHITQSSTEIWDKVCLCVREVLHKSGVLKDDVRGIGFDATCSLTVVDENSYDPVGVGPDFSNSDQNIILWMDHRAGNETKSINSTGHECLKYVGGQMSIEMEVPKIKWLKNNMSTDDFNRCKFYDLSDYLTFRATGNQRKSLCAAVCKQGFLPYGVDGSTEGWSKDFLESIDLKELVENNFAKLGGPLTDSNNSTTNYLSAGEFVGPLNERAAEELGLTVKCIVASGVIDAYAGWIGTVAAETELNGKHSIGSIGDFIGRLAVVAGTSTCHICLSKDPFLVNGVWGPYKDIMFRDFWCAEGGQSCTGELLSHILSSHPANKELLNLARSASMSHFDYLNSLLKEMVEVKKERSMLTLAKHLFFYGDLRGNRSPLADYTMNGSIIGLSMDTSIEDLALKYLVTCEFIAQQTRHIIQTMTDAGHKISALYVSGGQCRNNVLMNLLANATGYPVVIPRYIDSAVVFGAAILGCAASKSYNNSSNQQNQVILWDTMKDMTKSDYIITPKSKNDPDRLLLDIKYDIFLDMAQKQKDYRALVDRVEI